MAGCSSPGNGPAQSGQTALPAGVTGTSRYVLQPNVKVLTAAGGTRVAAATDTTVTLSGTRLTLAAGDILINDLPGTPPLLRKITTVRPQTDGTVVLSTTPANLGDVFTSADIRQTQVLAPSQLAGMKPARAGVSIGAPVALGGRAAAATASLGFDHCIAYDGSNGGAAAEFNGAVNFTLGFDTNFVMHRDYLVVPVVDDFKVVPFLLIDGRFTVTGKANGHFQSRFPVNLPFDVPLAGFGPISLGGRIQFYVEVEGTFNANGIMSVNGSMDMHFGIEYQRGPGWQGVHEFHHSFSVDPPHVYADASASLSIVKPQLDLTILGTGSVGIDADVLKVGLNFSYQSGSNPVWSVMPVAKPAFTVRAAVKLTVLTLFDGALPRVDLGTFNLLAQALQIHPGQGGGGGVTADTTRIVFVTGRLARPAIYMINADGTAETALVTSANAATQLYNPAISSDGLFIVYGSTGAHNGDLYERIISDGTTTNLSRGRTKPIAHPRIAPREDAVAFDAADADGHHQLCSLYLYNDLLLQLTNSANMPGDNRRPTWEPDARHLLFEHTPPAGGKSELWEWDIQTSTGRKISGQDKPRYTPVMSPNFTGIAYSSVDTGGSNQVLVADPAFIGANVIASPECTEPTWSPESDKLCYTRANGSGSDLWITPTATSNGDRKLTSGGKDSQPCWQGFRHYGQAVRAAQPAS